MPGNGNAHTRTPYGALLGAAAAVLALDQITKQLALAALADGDYEVIPGILWFRLAFNSGGAFGILQGVPEFFLVATALVVVVILVWAHRLEDRRLAVPLGILLGGGLGNVADRLFRGFDGRVVDFIDLRWWPTFNVADMAIVSGIALTLLLSARSAGREPASSERG